MTLGNKAYANNAANASGATLGARQTELVPMAEPITAAEAALRRLPGWHPSKPAFVLHENPTFGGNRGRSTGLKFVALGSAALMVAGRRLRPASLGVLVSVLWDYRPGHIYRRLNLALGAAAGLNARSKPFSERATYRAIEELCAKGVLVRVSDGFAVRLVEEHLPAEKRIKWQEPPEQVAFDFPLAHGMAEWLAKVAHEANGDDARRKSAAQSGAKACRQCGTTRWRTLSGAGVCEQCEP